MPRSARHAAADEYRAHMRRSNELHASYFADSEQLAQYDRFTQWQMDYLLSFFSDLHEREGYADAIDYTMSDLAGVGISERDRDLERAAPAITRMLPTKALETIAAAAKLNKRVLEINLGIFHELQVDGQLPGRISDRAYCTACRQAVSLEECLELVELAIGLGRTLKTLVKVPLLGGMLHAMHGPAHAAGFGALHEFLDNGYTYFKAIPDIEHFLDEIDLRMSQVFEAIYTWPLEEFSEDGTLGAEMALARLRSRAPTGLLYLEQLQQEHGHAGPRYEEGQRPDPRNRQRVGDEVHEPRPEVNCAGEGRGVIADAGKVRDDDQRRKHDEVLDAVVMRLLHALGPVRHGRRILRIAHGVDQPTDHDQVEDVGHPHHELNGEYPGQGGEFWGHDGSPYCLRSGFSWPDPSPRAAHHTPAWR